MTVTAEGTQGAGASLDRTRLLKDLQAQARLLEDDLRERTESEPRFRDALHAEYGKAVAAERTAAMYETWRDERVVQIAAAWVLACVFVRFSEDNGLIPDPWLSGPGDRLAEAQDRHGDFFRSSRPAAPPTPARPVAAAARGGPARHADAGRPNGGGGGPGHRVGGAGRAVPQERTDD
ncbi:hypothetical protein C1I97_04570 [Streptomyces sp. NTH33]|uniref:hypothetical protein n=1 Tax=Streptomyces sp. NTH33 TaxID=1735453 RepID=UPI000DA90553|nr:hypothetical protein [Streptomyces sp. NTH33]PZH17863.1 hypothetical protein C1I97_04570 [Streptomyces sp. NTH33]